MTAPLKKSQRLVEFKYKPIMSAWFAWKSGGTSTRYSFELRNTLKEIRYRGQLPHIDFDYGFQSLINLIEKHHKGNFICARIYGHRNDNDLHGVLLREYKYDELIIPEDPTKHPDIYPDFTAKKWQDKKDSLTQHLSYRIRHAQIVTSVLNSEILK